MQSTNTILLIRPANFGYNAETAISNTFQNTVVTDAASVHQKARDEFEEFAALLSAKGVEVVVFDDTPFPIKPDAVFPNNWITFHTDGTVILYPMCSPNRQLERRTDLITQVKKNFDVSSVIDLSVYEKENRFLEGTGSIVFDHTNKKAYASLSVRTDQSLFVKLCDMLNYEPIYFHSYDQNGKEIYHTNVMMCIGTSFAVVCLESITNEVQKAMVWKKLTDTQHQIIEISIAQMNAYAGNMLALSDKQGKQLLAMSKSAFDSLSALQKELLANYCELVPLSIPTIETIGGGSARCMIAEIFLNRKS